MMDLSTLSEEVLLAICVQIFKAAGYTVHASESQLGRGTIDALVSPPGSKAKWVVELRRRGDLAVLRRVASDVVAMQSRYGANKSLLITTRTLPAAAAQSITSETSCEIWDGRTLDDLLTRYGTIRNEVENLLEVQTSIIAPSPPSPTPPSDPSKVLAGRLTDLPPGQDDWRAYELLCIEIVNFVFSPHLRPHREDYRRSEDGLDIRDAIFPMLTGHPFWDRIHLHHRARMVVLECKNLSEELGQKEVESIAQYLYPRAMRSFGILCGRQGAKDSAAKARRRAWQESEKLIVMLSDVDLQEALRLKGAGEEPTALLDQQIDEFFIKLTP